MGSSANCSEDFHAEQCFFLNYTHRTVGLRQQIVAKVNPRKLLLCIVTDGYLNTSLSCFLYCIEEDYALMIW